MPLRKILGLLKPPDVDTAAAKRKSTPRKNVRTVIEYERIEPGGMTVQHTIRIQKQRRKNFMMKITPVGLVLFLPRSAKENSPAVRAFIEKGLDTLGKKITPLPPLQRTPEELRAMVDAWAVTMGVQPKRVQLREMYRKWGSCSTKGNVTLNTAVCHLPDALAEYVVCHELCHLTVHGHGAPFKQLMARYMPDFVERHKALHRFMRIASD